MARPRAGNCDAAEVETMADGDRTRSVPLTNNERTHSELRASRHELSMALTRRVEFLIKLIDLAPADAASHARFEWTVSYGAPIRKAS
jgi:hypothetical protein